MAGVANLRSTRISVRNLEAAYEHAYKNGWTDGLPVIPPTEKRVATMVEAIGRDAQEEIARIPPQMGRATVEKIAVNAVMAGCRPEYVPVVIAALEAMCEPGFNLNGIQATTNPVAPAIIVNGPIRKKLGLNCGHNCLGQGWRANATIGRATRLVLLNVGGATPGPVDRAVHGQPAKYGLCFGEDEEGSIWEPLHVERGFRADESAVTVVGISGTSNVPTARILDAGDMLMLIADSLGIVGSNDINAGGGQPAIVLTAGHTTFFSEAGYSKSDVKRVLFENSAVPLEKVPKGRIELELIRVQDGLVYPLKRPEDLVLVVAGAPEPYHAVMMHTFGATLVQTKPVAIA
ncbi:MAG: hypothetical protein HYX92_06770 [Chloroflexi bacterium]|nr:hypothetical protein [Chloroflexota bacterium]